MPDAAHGGDGLSSANDAADFDRAACAPALAHATRDEEAMKSNYKIAAAVVGSFVLGLGLASVLHAQAKPPAYVIGEITVKDEDAYKKDFLPLAQKQITDSGGKYIAGGFNKTWSINGEAPANRVVILQFANMDAVKAWQEGGGRDTQEKIGNKYATFRTFAVEGVEQK
jgi:uncharacterized protein (DUF1330 family)